MAPWRAGVRLVSDPSVSIVVACHNAAEFIEEALKSVQDQSLRDVECIVIDDASTDESVSIVKAVAAADSRFKLIAFRTNQGVAAARNAGIANATGRWIALLDADDLFRPERLERLTEIGDSRAADVVVDEQVVTRFPGVSSGQCAFGFRQREFRFTQEDFFAGSRLFRRALPTGYMKPIIRREFLQRTGILYDPSVASGEDFLFYAQLFAAGARCIATSFAGYIYRRRRVSLSRSDEHLHVHAQLGERLLGEFAAQLSPTSRSALVARARDFEDVARAMPALRALREKDWKGVAASFVRRPAIARTCLRLFRMRLSRSLSAHRT
jgi:succinoglycan biosynthesis protein ExoO